MSQSLFTILSFLSLNFLSISCRLSLNFYDSIFFSCPRGAGSKERGPCANMGESILTETGWLDSCFTVMLLVALGCCPPLVLSLEMQVVHWDFILWREISDPWWTSRHPFKALWRDSSILLTNNWQFHLYLIRKSPVTLEEGYSLAFWMLSFKILFFPYSCLIYIFVVVKLSKPTLSGPDVVWESLAVGIWLPLNLADKNISLWPELLIVSTKFLSAQSLDILSGH